MRYGYLRLRFQDDGDWTGKLTAQAEVGGFSGRGSAWFSVSQIEEFADKISAFPLPVDKKHVLAGGSWGQGRLEQEHLAIEIYPVDGRGHIGTQVRVASELWGEARPQSQLAARIELITSYQPLLEFSRDLVGLVRGFVEEVILEGEGFR
jgi:hypothetical protein